jgi:hypothetical protein
MRRFAAPFVDLLAKVRVRRADGVRTLSEFTTDLVREEGVEPIAEFPAFVDFGLYRHKPRSPLPARAALLFVGVLEDYEGIDVLAEAWREAAPRSSGSSVAVGSPMWSRGCSSISRPDAVVPGPRPDRAAERARPGNRTRAALADALAEVLVEPDWAAHLAAGAARSASDWLATPEEFAERVRDLVASLD